jgi:hypothetical protein
MDSSAYVNGIEIPDGGPPADQLAIQADADAPDVRAGDRPDLTTRHGQPRCG